VRLGLQESWTTEEVQLQRNAYDASIAALDAGLGELFRELERRGQLQNTLVILTADHGEEFHEHGLMGHGNSLYRESVHVPLILALPGRIPGDARRSVPVSLRDIPATVLDLVGMPDSGSLPGRSLARYFASAPDAGETTDSLLSEVRYASGLLPHYPAGHGDMQSLLLDGDRYIHNSGDGREELFDFERDTAEAHDLSALPAGAAKLTRLRDALKVALQPADTGNRP
jgi:arylsulfatase A-like enzyme